MIGGSLLAQGTRESANSPEKLAQTIEYNDPFALTNQWVCLEDIGGWARSVGAMIL